MIDRRKKILFLAASLIAFGIGFLSSLRQEAPRDQTAAPVTSAQVCAR